MTSIPDPLFRNGLENYQKFAPASAWERIESRLDRKRRKGVWLKVAAGLFLLIATLTVFWQYDPTDTSVAAISKESTPVTLKTDTIVSVAQEAAKPSLRESSVVSREEKVSSQQLAVNSKQSTVSSQQSAVSSQQLVVASTKSVIPADEVQLITMTKPEEIITELTPINSIEGSGNDVFVEEKGTNITYTAEQVNTRFIKKDLPTQATPAKKNTSGIKKVIDIALELTNEGTVYSDLREKKNEWLSFTMLSNKTEANK